MVIYKTRVLITAYNRPLELSKLLSSSFIRSAKNIQVSIDGPESTKDGQKMFKDMLEVVKNSDVSHNIDVYSNKSRLGLYGGVRSALVRNFSQHERVIVLEEDCIPHPKLWHYIQALDRIENIKAQDRHVCFSRHVRNSRFNPLDLTLTKYPFVWGWMLSSNAWQKIDKPIASTVKVDFKRKLESFSNTRSGFVDFWLEMYDACLDIEIARAADTLDDLDYSKGLRSWARESWASPYVINTWLHGDYQHSIRPHVNFIENVGFTQMSTHTKIKPNHARRLGKYQEDLALRFKGDSSRFDLHEDSKVFGIR